MTVVLLDAAASPTNEQTENLDEAELSAAERKSRAPIGGKYIYNKQFQAVPNQFFFTK